MPDEDYCWRVWCITEGGWVCTWSDTEPTECPNDSSHVIDPDKTVCFDIADHLDIAIREWVLQQKLECGMGQTFGLSFIRGGSVSDAWLYAEAGCVVPSNYVPGIVLYNSQLIGMSFANKYNNKSCDIMVCKNGVTYDNLIVTWPISDRRWAYKTDYSGIILNAGDRISVYCKKTEDNPYDVVVRLQFKRTDSVSGEGSGNI